MYYNIFYCKNSKKMMIMNAKMCIFAVIFCFVQCTSSDIKPRVVAVSVEKQYLQQANVYWSKKENDMLKAFVYRQNLTMQPHPSGYYSQIIQRGNGDVTRNGNGVALNAQIYLLDGTLCYDYDDKHPLIFSVGKSVAMSGLHIALNGLQQGTEALFLFPSHLGYGLVGDRNKIPPQSPLLCKIKVVSVE
ncbi:peptidyl-prolyl cis-trans isomerase [Bacteroidia bacterium]|nr:peptidyl-prolyl cis-trans isomerase [Bacteroidia bacterium]